MSKKLKTTTSYIIIGIIFAVVIAGAAIYYAYQEGRNIRNKIDKARKNIADF